MVGLLCFTRYASIHTYSIHANLMELQIKWKMRKRDPGLLLMTQKMRSHFSPVYL